jgi:hypothetical protein
MMLQSTRIYKFGLALAVPALIVTGACSKESKQPSPVTTATEAGKTRAPESALAAAHLEQALVRFVNAMPDGKAVDVSANGNATFAGVAYKAVTPYKNVPSTADAFAIAAAGEAQAPPLAQRSSSISAGRHYTILALPGSAPDSALSGAARQAPGTLELQVIEDDIQPPSEGKARVRVINASPDAPTLAVFVKGGQEVLFSDIDFKEAASYKEVDPMSGTLEFRSIAPRIAATQVPGATAASPRSAPNGARDAKTDNPLADARTPALATTRVTLEAGKTYTLIVVGHRQGRSGAIDTILIEDSLTGPQIAPTE